MSIEGIKGIGEVLKHLKPFIDKISNEGIKNTLIFIFVISIVVFTLFSLFPESKKLFASTDSKAVNFTGVVMSGEGVFLENVKVYVEGARANPVYTSTDGRYAFNLVEKDLPDKCFKIVYQLKEGQSISRSVSFEDNCFYHEIIIK